MNINLIRVCILYNRYYYSKTRLTLSICYAYVLYKHFLVYLCTIYELIYYTELYQEDPYLVAEGLMIKIKHDLWKISAWKKMIISNGFISDHFPCKFFSIQKSLLEAVLWIIVELKICPFYFYVVKFTFCLISIIQSCFISWLFL